MFLARKISARHGIFRREEIFQSAFDDDVAAKLSGERADIDDGVRRADRLFVVLDDDHGVAFVAQALQSLQQFVIVARMQADGRLVQNIRGADEAGADLRGEPHALRFSARQSGGGAV